MYIPSWFIVVAVLLSVANFALELVALGMTLRCRHHEHLIPATPRSPRG